MTYTQDKVIKEISELPVESERKEETTPQKTQVKVRVKRDLGLNQPLDKDTFSKTTAGFFKSPTLKKPEITRPKSSYKENRKEITHEEEEYLQNTFHPDIKWKII